MLTVNDSHRFGTSDTLSAWMVSFMIEKRKSPEAASRYQLSGLWGGEWRLRQFRRPSVLTVSL